MMNTTYTEPRRTAAMTTLIVRECSTCNYAAYDMRGDSIMRRSAKRIIITCNDHN